MQNLMTDPSIIQLIRENEALIRQNEDLMMDKNDLRENLTDLRTQNRALLAEMDALKAERAVWRAEADELRAERDGLRAARDELNGGPIGEHLEECLETQKTALFCHTPTSSNPGSPTSWRFVKHDAFKAVGKLCVEELHRSPMLKPGEVVDAVTVINGAHDTIQAYLMDLVKSVKEAGEWNNWARIWAHARYVWANRVTNEKSSSTNHHSIPAN